MTRENQADLDCLQGTWSQIYLEADGVVEPQDDEHSVPGAVCIFSGTTFRVIAPNDDILLEGVFELDATSQPKSITWIDSIGEDAGKRLPAIYELSQDSFRFIAANEGQDRPQAFKTVPGLTMRAFTRVQGL